MSSAAVSTKEINSDAWTHVHLFRGVEPETIEGILKSCPVRVLRTGEILASPGKPDHSLYAILRGRLSARDARESMPLYMFEAGECVGESAVLDHKPYVHFIIAEEATEVLMLDEEKFLTLINTSHETACNFLLGLTRALRAQPNDADNAALQQRYQRLASTDPLTGLHNQRWFEDLLSRQIMRSSMDHKPLSLVVVDIDRLAEVNRQFGQAAGDQAVYTVAQTLMQNCRPTDLIARLGGDKFAVLLPDTDLAGAETAARHLLEIVARTTIVIPHECVLPPVTASAGVGQLKSFVAAERFLADVGAALARAQKQGGNAAAI